MLNLKVRARNKAFWVALIPAILLLVQNIVGMFGVQLDFSVLSEQLLAVINGVFALLAILGVVIDPTTPGVADDEEVMGLE